MDDNMETTEEHNYGSVQGNGQECQDHRSSCSDKQYVLPSKKRSAIFFSDDEGSSLPKYRKLTGQRITTMAEEKASYTISASDISSDEFSNSEGIKIGDKDASDSAMNESSEASNFDCVNNGNMSAEEKCQKYLDAASESDVSFDISPQKELPVLDSVENVIREKHKIMQKFAFISSAVKFHSSVLQTSQFSCNDESEENNTEVNDLSNTLKRSNSQISNSECMQQEITSAELSNVSAHEEIVPATSLETSDVHNFNVQYVDQETNIKDLISNEQFAIIEEASDKNSNSIIKQNGSSIIEESEIQPGIGEQNNVGNMINNTLNQNYIEENRISDKSPHFYSPENLHQSSHPKAEQNIISETSRANSVSDLNLAQLVLSLKDDIKDLSKKIEKQENILDAVVHLNEISLAPLFTPSFPEKYNLNIPFNTIEEFDKFNEDLTKDPKFLNEFVTSLCSYVDNNVTLAKNILTMMRKYMSKDLVSLYTASKATANKMVLKDTIFCKCLLQATRMTIRNGLLPLEHEKAFIKGLGIVVSGSKGWHTFEEENKKHD